jgi:hypothetical protein
VLFAKQGDGRWLWSRRCYGAGAGIGDLGRDAEPMRPDPPRNGNLSDHAILRLFCPTRQWFRQTPKPLIPLVRATVHGVVFDIFVLEGTKASG